MTKRSLTIELEADLFKVLEKRAKKNFMTPREMLEDIVRRSMISYKGGSAEEQKIDDALVGVFSRVKRKKK